jgi:hypothetical protein
VCERLEDELVRIVLLAAEGREQLPAIYVSGVNRHASKGCTRGAAD